MAPSCGEQEFIANFHSHKLVAKQTGVEALVQSLPPKFHCQDQLEYHENDNDCEYDHDVHEDDMR